MFDKTGKAIVLGRTSHTIKKANINQHSMLDYESVFNSSSVCCQSSPMQCAETDCNKQCDNDTTLQSLSLTESCFGSLSGESFDTTKTESNISGEMNTPEYSVTAGSKPLSVIFRKCYININKGSASPSCRNKSSNSLIEGAKMLRETLLANDQQEKMLDQNNIHLLKEQSVMDEKCIEDTGIGQECSKICDINIVPKEQYFTINDYLQLPSNSSSTGDELVSFPSKCVVVDRNTSEKCYDTVLQVCSASGDPVDCSVKSISTPPVSLSSFDKQYNIGEMDDMNVSESLKLSLQQSANANCEWADNGISVKHLNDAIFEMAKCENFTMLKQPCDTILLTNADEIYSCTTKPCQLQMDTEVSSSVATSSEDIEIPVAKLNDVRVMETSPIHLYTSKINNEFSVLMNPEDKGNIWSNREGSCVQHAVLMKMEKACTTQLDKNIVSSPLINGNSDVLEAHQASEGRELSVVQMKYIGNCMQTMSINMSYPSDGETLQLNEMLHTTERKDSSKTLENDDKEQYVLANAKGNVLTKLSTACYQESIMLPLNAEIEKLCNNKRDIHQLKGSPTFTSNSFENNNFKLATENKEIRGSEIVPGNIDLHINGKVTLKSYESDKLQPKPLSLNDPQVNQFSKQMELINDELLIPNMDFAQNQAVSTNLDCVNKHEYCIVPDSESQYTSLCIGKNNILHTCSEVKPSEECKPILYDDMKVEKSLLVEGIGNDLSASSCQAKLLTSDVSNQPEITMLSDTENSVVKGGRGFKSVTGESENAFLIAMSHSGELLSTIEVPLYNAEIHFKDSSVLTEISSINNKSRLKHHLQHIGIVDNGDKHVNSHSEVNIVNVIESVTSSPRTVDTTVGLLSPVTDARVSYNAEYSGNSPLLFSDEDSSDNTDEKKHFFSTSSNYEKIISAEQQRLNHLQELLAGVPPPPSITVPQYNVLDILRLIQDNHQLMSFKGKDDGIQHWNNFLKSNMAHEDVLECGWPAVKLCCYHDIQYNHGVVSEEFESQCQKLQQRFVGCETTSTCNVWFGLTDVSEVHKNRRKVGQSPGRRLSHLARRRRMFNSSSLQGSTMGKFSGHLQSERRMILVDVKKNETKKPKILQSKKHVDIHDGHQRFTHSKLNSSKRALFQSPTDTETIPSSKSQNINKIDRSKVQNSICALFPDTSACNTLPAISDSQEKSNSVIYGKRYRSDSEETSRKRPRIEYVLNTGSKSSSSNCSLDSVSDRLDSYDDSRCQSTSSANGHKKELNSNHKKKLLWAVAEALKTEGISIHNPIFRRCATSLAKICRPHFLDLMESQKTQPDKGSTSDCMLNIATKYVKNVVAQHQLEEVT